MRRGLAVVIVRSTLIYVNEPNDSFFIDIFKKYASFLGNFLHFLMQLSGEMKADTVVKRPRSWSTRRFLLLLVVVPRHGIPPFYRSVCREMLGSSDPIRFRLLQKVTPE